MSVTSSSHHGPRVIELTEGNYGDWAEQTFAWARGKKGRLHLEPDAGTANPPIFPEGAPGEALQQAWQDLDDVIAAHLMQTLTPAQKAHIPDRNATAATIWKTLRDVHRAKTFINYHSDYRLLESLRYVDGAKVTMQQHIHAMAELRNRIHAAGFYLPEPTTVASSSTHFLTHGRQYASAWNSSHSAHLRHCPHFPRVLRGVVDVWS
jgi:hypothetical protein